MAPVSAGGDDATSAFIFKGTFNQKINVSDANPMIASL
jgi:hypothetical protein